MKKYFTIFFCITIILFAACKKDFPDERIFGNDWCNDPFLITQYYLLRSSPYDSLYNGVLVRPFSAFGPDYLFPDEYLYNYIALPNPTNKLEIALKRSGRHEELLTYNLLTNKTVILAVDDLMWFSWMNNNWLTFYDYSLGLCKIKSNGDSLTIISDESNFASIPNWNSEGSMYYTYNPYPYELYCYREVGLIATYHYEGTPYGWLNNSEVVIYNNGLISTLNLTNGDLRTLTRINATAIFLYDQASQRLVYDVNNLRFSVDLQTLETKNYGKVVEFEESIIIFPYALIYDKLLCTLSLKDTATGDGRNINYRKHLGVSDINGNNIRKLEVPE